MRRLRVGYVPLTDAAVLIAAAERGFAESEGLALELVREASWASVRDKLIFGMFDAAHMLAPFAIATSLGLSHIRVPLSAPFVLNLNGNAITLSSSLFADMAELLGRVPRGPRETATALSAVMAARGLRGCAALTLGMAFTFSTHHYLLRHWLRLGGIDSERDLRLVVVPPPYMVDGLNTGLLDGFCVGSPWNSLAADMGTGRIAVLGAEIAARAPEKVLALPRATVENDRNLVLTLVRVLRNAARWCDGPENRNELSQILASPRHLNLPAALIRQTLEGRIDQGGSGERLVHPKFLPLGAPGVNRPDVRHALWLYGEIVRAGQTEFGRDAAKEAADVYCADLYDEATGETAQSEESDAVMLACGPPLLADDIRSYLAALGMQTHKF
jgi:NitT/TauT family transport system ATP-binding protein